MTDILLYTAMFFGSLFVLVKASDYFVESAEKIGLAFGISPFIIGVTIVAFGTSLPELAASIAAVFAGQSEIVINTVVGSNIANILLVLGIVAIIAKEVNLTYRVMAIDVPLLLASGFLLWFAMYDQNFTLFEALVFLAALIVFLVNSFQSDDEEKSEDRPKVNWKVYSLLVLGGIFVYLGAEYTIYAIQKLSEIAQLDPGIIAATLVALGTSLPEVVVSIVAVRAGKTGIAIGNVLGSNIFNTYAVVGIPSFFGNLELGAEVLDFRLPFMVAVTILFAIICVSNKLSRWAGVMLILFYVFFMVELFQ